LMVSLLLNNGPGIYGFMSRFFVNFPSFGIQNIRPHNASQFFRRWWRGHLHPPSEHLGFFCGNQKTQVFAPFAANGNTARIKIAP